MRWCSAIRGSLSASGKPQVPREGLGRTLIGASDRKRTDGGRPCARALHHDLRRRGHLLQGLGRPVRLCSSAHGWPLNSDSWEAQALFLAEHGFRVIAHDRRGHGRSTQTWDGNDMDPTPTTWPRLIEMLDLRDEILVGFSTGGGEVSRYIGRHGTERVAGPSSRAVPPFMLKTDDNPGGVPIEVFDGLRAGSLADRSQLYRELAEGPFFGGNRKRVASQGVRDAFWPRACSRVTATSYESNRRVLGHRLPRRPGHVDVPTLVIHGDDDQVVPFEVGGKASARAHPGRRSRLTSVYPGAPHGVTDTHKDQLNADLLAFARRLRTTDGTARSVASFDR